MSAKCQHGEYVCCYCQEDYQSFAGLKQQLNAEHEAHAATKLVLENTQRAASRLWEERDEARRALEQYRKLIWLPLSVREGGKSPEEWYLAGQQLLQHYQTALQRAEQVTLEWVVKKLRDFANRAYLPTEPTTEIRLALFNAADAFERTAARAVSSCKHCGVSLPLAPNACHASSCPYTKRVRT